MSIAVGNKVKFLNIAGGGVVKKILPNNKVLVEDESGFDFEFSSSELIVMKDNDTHHYKVDNSAISDKIQPSSSFHRVDNSTILNQYVRTTKFQYDHVVEVDLHLEELMEFPGRLDDWQKLHKQMQHFKACLSAAITKKIRRIVFVHGVGQGILKTEIRNYLANYPNIVAKDADFNEYGNGATEVIIKNS